MPNARSRTGTAARGPAAQTPLELLDHNRQFRLESFTHPNVSFVLAQLLDHPFEHQSIQPRRPAEALQLRQETACGNGLALGVEQA